VNARGDIQFFLLGQKSKSNNGYRDDFLNIVIFLPIFQHLTA
jgi:hypothetical protein